VVESAPSPAPGSPLHEVEAEAVADKAAVGAAEAEVEATPADAFKAYSIRFHSMLEQELAADTDLWGHVEAACRAHAILRQLDAPDRSLKDMIMKQSRSMWSLTKNSWKEQVIKRRTAESTQRLPPLSDAGLAALFAYTLNSPPVFMLLNVVARNTPTESRKSMRGVLDFTLKAATHLEHEPGGQTYFRGMSQTECNWYVDGGKLPSHLISCSLTEKGASAFASLPSTRSVKVTVHGGVHAVRLTSLTGACHEEAEVVVIPKVGDYVEATSDDHGRLLELVIKTSAQEEMAVAEAEDVPPPVPVVAPPPSSAASSLPPSMPPSMPPPVTPPVPPPVSSSAPPPSSAPSPRAQSPSSK
jgi:hypothetical protein